MKPRRDRTLLVVLGASIAAGAIVAAGPGCSSEGRVTSNGDDALVNTDDAAAPVNTNGYVGNTSVPWDSAPPDTIVNTDGYVGNTAAPYDTAIPDTASDSVEDASADVDAPGG